MLEIYKYQNRESNQMKFMLEDSQDLFVVEKTICEEKPISPSSPVNHAQTDSENMVSTDEFGEEEVFLKDDSEKVGDKVRNAWANKYSGAVENQNLDQTADSISDSIPKLNLT